VVIGSGELNQALQVVNEIRFRGQP
jgi:hypothetical protein